MSSPPVEEHAAWLGPDHPILARALAEATHPSGKPWIFPNGPRLPPLNDDRTMNYWPNAAVSGPEMCGQWRQP